MPDLAYWSVVAVGAFTLIVEADRQFRRPAQIDTLMKYDVLADVEATSFSARTERFRGHAFYIACYLVAYGTILSSISLQQLLLRTESGQQRAGSNFEDESPTATVRSTRRSDRASSSGSPSASR